MKGTENALHFSEEEFSQEIKDLWAIRDGFLNEARLIHCDRESVPLSFSEKNELLQKLSEVINELVQIRELAESIPSAPVPSGPRPRFDNLLYSLKTFRIPIRNTFRVVRSLSSVGGELMQGALRKAKCVEDRIEMLKVVRVEKRKALEVREGIKNLLRSGEMTEAMREELLLTLQVLLEKK